MVYLQIIKLTRAPLHAQTTPEQSLASADAALLDARCRQPTGLVNEILCAALARTLEGCQQRFGAFTLRCSNSGATACSSSMAVIQHGRCGACSLAHDQAPLARQETVHVRTCCAPRS